MRELRLHPQLLIVDIAIRELCTPTAHPQASFLFLETLSRLREYARTGLIHTLYVTPFLLSYNELHFAYGTQ